jgi:hypothetical protein
MGGTRVRAGQFIVAEVVLVLVVIAFTGPTWLFVGVAAAAAAVLLATFGRVDGRWYYEAALGYERFRRRRARVAAELVAATIDALDPDLAWLRTIAPDLRIRPVSSRSSSPVGVGTDEHGWFGAVATDGVLPGPALAALLADAAVAVSVAQGVIRPDGRLGFVAVRLSTPDAVDLERAHGLPALDAATGFWPRWSRRTGWTGRPRSTGVAGPPAPARTRSTCCGPGSGRTRWSAWRGRPGRSRSPPTAHPPCWYG